MFKKARNRIMFFNMAMVSSVVIAAFSIIFFSVYAREQSSIQSKLSSDVRSEMIMTGRGILSGQHITVDESGIQPVITIGSERRILSNLGISFSLLTDTDGNLVEIYSLLELPDNAYRQMALEAVQKDGSTNTVTFNGHIWQYSINPVTVVFQEQFDLSYIVSNAFNYVRFLDITDSHKMLWSLAFTLSGLLIVILTVLFLISMFFANRAIRPMKEAWDKQNRFVADASHELKTPLSVINANCGVLYSGQDEPVRNHIKWINNITRAADRMTGLVSDMLSLARLEDGEHPLIPVLINVSGIVSEVISEIEPAALEKGIEIKRQIGTDIEIESDKEHIRRVLSILMDNAVKYTESGGTIFIMLQKKKNSADFIIRNSGEGISKEDIPKVFDRFYRGDPARASANSGYGLGLAIAKAISKQLGAKLTVNSEYGRYTEFQFLLENKMQR